MDWDVIADGNGWSIRTEDPTEARDRQIVEAETSAERDTLFDLAERCSNDTTMRREATDALRGIIRSHEPPEQPWARRL